MAAIAAMAENPYEVERHFVRGDFDLGIYMLCLHVNGKITTVTIDDFIPVDPATGKELGATTK